MSKIIKFDEDARRGMESGLNLLLGAVDFLTASAALFRSETAELLHEHRKAARFAEVACLGVLESGSGIRLSEFTLRGLDEFGKFLHFEFQNLKNLADAIECRCRTCGEKKRD